MSYPPCTHGNYPWSCGICGEAELKEARAKLYPKLIKKGFTRREAKKACAQLKPKFERQMDEARKLF